MRPPSLLDHIVTFLVPGIIFMFSLALLGMNIFFESEPGAIPLFLTISTATWLIVKRYKSQTQSSH